MNAPPVNATPHPTAFWYLRHGETDWNAQNLAQGNVDTQLNATGLAQARAATEKLRNRGITAIHASPMRRARTTAEIVGEALGLPVTLDNDLREVSFGINEGKPMLADWFNDWVHERFTPEGGEPFDVLRTRAVAAVNRALASPPVVLIVAHGALFRSLRAAMGLPPDVRLPNATPTFCAPPATEGAPWELTVAT